MSEPVEPKIVERPEPTDAELVRLARRADLGAFEVLVGRYQRQATAVAYRLLSNREDAMDVVQDAFVRLAAQTTG